MTDYVRYPNEDENFEKFRGDADENLGLVHDMEALLVSFLQSPMYDEPYKLGPKPDLEAFGELLRHLKAAHAALRRVEASCEERCTAEYDGLRCEMDNHHEGNHQTHRGDLLHVWGTVFYVNKDPPWRVTTPAKNSSKP